MWYPGIYPASKIFKGQRLNQSQLLKSPLPMGSWDTWRLIRYTYSLYGCLFLSCKHTQKHTGLYITKLFDETHSIQCPNTV